MGSNEGAGPSNTSQRLLTRRTDCRRIACFNLKGGVGKTTTVVHLACALATGGKKVVVIDADCQKNCTDFLLGIKQQHENPVPTFKQKKAKHSDDPPPVEDAAGNALNPDHPDEPFHPFVENMRDFVGKGTLGPGELNQAQKYISHDEGTDTIKSVLRKYFSDSFPRECPALVKIGGEFEDNLFLLPGSSMIDLIVGWPLGETDYKDPGRHGKIWACWHHLLCLIEKKYKPDVILLDLNPSPSKLNTLALLSCEYILPPVGLSQYDISASHEFLTKVLEQTLSMGQEILAYQYESNPNLSNTDKDSLREFKKMAEDKGGVFPSIPKDKNRVKTPLMPYVLPFLAQKYNVWNGKSRDLRQQLAQPPTIFLKVLREVITHAYTHIESEAVRDNTVSSQNSEHLLKSFYYHDKFPTVEGPARAALIGRAMAIPFLKNCEACTAVCFSQKKSLSSVSRLDYDRHGYEHGQVISSEMKESFDAELSYMKNKYDLLAVAILHPNTNRKLN